MFDRPTRLFLRWRDRGCAASLAELFDRTAPELLRLGLHLCGNVADAEDLVQGTFLAAIESAGRFEKSKRVTPWLVGILTHRAQAERRRSKRAPVVGGDGDILPATEDSPETHAVRSELGEAARAALDGLREPFRQPTLLRFVHGMEPAEIALVLNRSPGTVRAQIHRGIEQARRALPAGVVAFAVTVGCAGRGLAAVKQVVVGAGAKATAAASVAGTLAVTFGITSGVVMSKKGLVALAMVFALGLGGTAWWLADDGTAPMDVVASDLRPVLAAANATSDAAEKDAATGERQNAQRSAPPAADVADASWTLRARVVDGPTKQPIAGALVELFGPRSMTLLELQRELADVARPGALGVPFADASTFALPRDLPFEVRLGGAAHSFLVPPTDTAKPLTHTRSSADGSFDLPVPESGGVLAVTANDRAVRHVAFANPPEAAEVIEVWPASRVTGVVRTDRGEIPPSPIELLLWSDKGTWRATSDAQGRFEATIAAEFAMVACRTPGWTATRERILPTGQRWIESRTLRAGQDGTVYVKRYGAARLHVTDAVTGTAIETFDLLTYDQFRGPGHCGRFVARNGWFALDLNGSENFLEASPVGREARANRVSLTVWSNGYLPFNASDIELYGDQPTIVEAKLERGSMKPLLGRVVRGGEPVDGARISLRPYNPSSWQHNTEWVLAAQKTDASGVFRLQVPGGEYVCEVFAGDACEAQFAVSLPHEEPLVIDLTDSVYVEVTVLDAAGQPNPNHNVHVSGERYQQRTGQTGPDGHLTLGPFAPGTLRATAPLLPTEHSWSGAVTGTVDAPAKSRPHLTLRLPDTATIRVSLAFEGSRPETGFAGFTASDLRTGTKTVDAKVEDSGIVPLDLLPGGSTLHVEAPDGRLWELEIPTGTRPGAVLSLRWRGLAYAGTVMQQNGKPLADGRVFATPVGGGPSLSVKTGADGSFRVEGLDAREHFLAFDTDRSSPAHGHSGNPYRLERFRPDALPCQEPSPLRVRLAAYRDGKFVDREDQTLRGRIVDSNGVAIPGAIVNAMTTERQDGGVLELFPLSGGQTCDDAGTFRIRITRGAQHRVFLYRKGGEPSHTEDIALPAESEVQRDFVLK